MTTEAEAEQAGEETVIESTPDVGQITERVEPTDSMIGATENGIWV